MIEGAQDRRRAYIRGRRKQDGSCAERHACRNGEKSSASLMDDRRLSFLAKRSRFDRTIRFWHYGGDAKGGGKWKVRVRAEKAG